MIEIIKKGTKQVKVCKNCGCKFTFENEDTHMEDTDNYKAFIEYVKCPQCETKIITRQSR